MKAASRTSGQEPLLTEAFCFLSLSSEWFPLLFLQILNSFSLLFSFSLILSILILFSFSFFSFSQRRKWIASPWPWGRTLPDWVNHGRCTDAFTAPDLTTSYWSEQTLFEGKELYGELLWLLPFKVFSSFFLKDFVLGDSPPTFASVWRWHSDTCDSLYD